MAPGHLDALRVEDELGLPAHHAVALGVDAGQADAVIRERRQEAVGERAPAPVGEALLAPGGLRQIADDGAILVRPGRVVAWRRATAVEDPRAALSEALGQVLARPDLGLTSTPAASGALA